MNAQWLMLAALLTVLIVILGIMGGFLIRLTRRIESLRESLPGQSVTDVPTSMLVTAVSRMEQRLSALESSQRQSEPMPSSGAGDRSYALAQRLVRQGASAEQIAEACGIGLQEAELMRRMHTSP